MALLDDVNRAIGEAMKAREHVRLDALRMLKSALVNREVELGRRLDETESRQVVSSQIKQRRESILQFRAAGRHELADKETAEITVLQAYMPASADPAEVERAVADAIAESGAASAKDLGKVMKLAMAKLSGKSVDGKAVNELARKKLAGQ
jgi:uncharacterized protein YqeY